MNISWLPLYFSGLGLDGHFFRRITIITFTWSCPRGVAGYSEVLAVGEAFMRTGPLESLTPCKSS
jgi:hypothetical protein